MSDTSDTAEKRQRCAALRKDGQPCQALAMHTGLCMAHAPEANRWRAQGGTASRSANRAAKLLPSRLAPMVAKLESVFDELYAASGEKRTARDAAALATVALAVVKVFQAGEHEERLREIERRVAAQQQEQARWSGAARWRA